MTKSPDNTPSQPTEPELKTLPHDEVDTRTLQERAALSLPATHLEKPESNVLLDETPEQENDGVIDSEKPTLEPSERDVEQSELKEARPVSIDADEADEVRSANDKPVDKECEPSESDVSPESAGIAALEYPTFDNRRRLLGLFPSYWLLKGYRPLPFGVTMVLIAALAFWAIVVSGWIVVPLPPFQWVAKTAEDAVSSGVMPTSDFIGHPVWVGCQALLAVVIGAFMGPRWSSVLYAAYVLGGMFGLPWFANGGGVGYILQPGFGYLIGLWVTAIMSGIAFNLALPPRRPRTQKEIKLRQRAERLRLQKQRTGRHSLLSRLNMAVSFLVRVIQPHPKKTLGWMGWVARTIIMTAFCVGITHLLGASWTTLLGTLKLIPTGAAQQVIADLTLHVWPYDVVITAAVLLWVLPIKAILNPIYR